MKFLFQTQKISGAALQGAAGVQPASPARAQSPSKAPPLSYQAAPAQACWADCHNDETFDDLVRLKDIPQERFFKSDSNHGFDVNELLRWVSHKRAWLNPHTNQDFTPDDVSRLRAHSSASQALRRLDTLAAQDAETAEFLLHEGQAGEALLAATQALTFAPDHAQARLVYAEVLGLPSPTPPGPAAALQLPQARSASLAPAHLGVPLATWRALRDLGEALSQDTSPELEASYVALATWHSHEERLTAGIHTSIDSAVRIFGHGFSQQLNAAEFGTTVGGRHCGVTDLGLQLVKAVQANGPKSL